MTIAVEEARKGWNDGLSKDLPTRLSRIQVDICHQLAARTLHQRIHAAIGDLALLISPTLVIADATRVMMRNGPTGGRISDVQPGGLLGRPAVLAAVDPVAADAWCCENLLGRDPALLQYVELAARNIAAQTAAGVKRPGTLDWRAYDRQGLIVRVDL